MPIDYSNIKRFFSLLGTRNYYEGVDPDPKWFWQKRCGFGLAWSLSFGSLPARENKLIGEHWLETALGRINAGDDEREVLLDYGYVRGGPLLEKRGKHDN